MAYALDEALAIRLALEDADRVRPTSAHPAFARLDSVLAGRGPRYTDDGLAYQDPASLFREEMARRAAEGLVN